MVLRLGKFLISIRTLFHRTKEQKDIPRPKTRANIPKALDLSPENDDDGLSPLPSGQSMPSATSDRTISTPGHSPPDAEPFSKMLTDHKDQRDASDEGQESTSSTDVQPSSGSILAGSKDVVINDGIFVACHSADLVAQSPHSQHHQSLLTAGAIWTNLNTRAELHHQASFANPYDGMYALFLPLVLILGSVSYRHIVEAIMAALPLVSERGGRYIRDSQN